MAAQWQKRLLKSKAAHLILSYVAAFAMRCVYYSSRRTHHFTETVMPYWRGEKRGIFAFWHGRMIMMPFLRPPGEFAVLSSHHNDGTLITTCMKRFDIHAIRGSKKSGGSEAVRELIEAAAHGVNLAITPDGPRGPFQVAAPGAIYVAMRTGLPIICISFSAARHWRLRSWDKFMVPKPFSHIHFTASEPMMVPANLDDSQLADAVAVMQQELNKITMQADNACGVAA